MFRQDDERPLTPTTFYSNLFKTSEFIPRPTVLNWQIVDGPGDKDKTNCQKMGRFRPHARGIVPIGARKDDYIFTVNSRSLPLTCKDVVFPGNSVSRPWGECIIGKYILLTNQMGRVVSCTRIRRVPVRNVYVIFAHDGVRGKSNESNTYDKFSLPFILSRLLSNVFISYQSI